MQKIGESHGRNTTFGTFNVVAVSRYRIDDCRGPRHCPIWSGPACQAGYANRRLAGDRLRMRLRSHTAWDGSLQLEQNTAGRPTEIFLRTGLPHRLLGRVGAHGSDAWLRNKPDSSKRRVRRGAAEVLVR